MNYEDIKKKFTSEYHQEIVKLFTIHNLTLDEAYDNSDPRVNSPGVYIFWEPVKGVIKVGKSQSNSKSRAFQHINDGTRNDKFDMKSLAGDSDARLILFNVQNSANIHWVVGLEYFMEKKLDPEIPSSRSG